MNWLEALQALSPQQRAVEHLFLRWHGRFSRIRSLRTAEDFAMENGFEKEMQDEDVN
jgi:hypothetical protein